MYKIFFFLLIPSTQYCFIIFACEDVFVTLAISKSPSGILLQYEFGNIYHTLEGITITNAIWETLGIEWRGWVGRGREGSLYILQKMAVRVYITSPWKRRGRKEHLSGFRVGSYELLSLYKEEQLFEYTFPFSVSSSSSWKVFCF